MIHFVRTRAAVITGAVAALVTAGLAGSAIAVAATSSAAPPAASRACVGTVDGVPRVPSNVYENPGSFPGCTKAQGFAVSLDGVSVTGMSVSNGSLVLTLSNGKTLSAKLPAAAVPATQYGVANFRVDTGSGPATWGTYSAALGSPAGDTAAGTVRFTCRNVTSGCNVSLNAYATVAGYSVYPRIILEKEDNATGDKQTCEYADGSTNEGGTTALGTAGSAPAAVPLAVGSTFDCGSAVQTGTPADGVPYINVPGASGQGIHYDAFITLKFAK